MFALVTLVPKLINYFLRVKYPMHSKNFLKDKVNFILKFTSRKRIVFT